MSDAGGRARRARSCCRHGEIVGRGPAGRRVQRHAVLRDRRDGTLTAAASTSRSRGSGRCGTSRTARWPAARSRRTRCPRRPAGASCRRPCCATGRSARAWCQLWIDTVDDDAATLVDVMAPDALPDGWLRVLDALGSDGEPVVLGHADDERLRRMAVLDVVLNNADRKGGHVLVEPDGAVHGVDHGVSFHAEPKLRTVLWGWAGEPLTADRGRGAGGAPRRPARTASSGTTLADAAHRGRGARHAAAGSTGCCTRAGCRSRPRGGRRSPGRRSDAAAPSHVGSPPCTPGPLPTIPDLPGAGLPLRLHDTATGAGAPDRARADRPDVRLRHHALRRDPHRPRGDLRRLRPGAPRLARRRPRRALRAERHRRRRPAARAGRARRRGLGGAGRARDDAVPRGHGGARRCCRRATTSARSRRSRTSSTAVRTAARAGRGVRRRRRHLLLGAQPTRGSAASATWTTRRCSRCSPSAAATRTGRARSTRSTACSGRRPARASRPGTPATPSCRTGRPGWHVECAAIALRPPRRRLRRAGRRQRPGLPAPRDERVRGAGADRQLAVRPALRARRAWSASTARRCRSRKGNLVFVSALRRDGHDPMAIRLALLGPPLPRRLGLDRPTTSWRPRPGWPAGGTRWPGRPGRPADGVLAEVRRHLADDLDAPGALAAVDRWADGGRHPRRTRRGRAPAWSRRTVDALLGVRL